MAKFIIEVDDNIIREKIEELNDNEKLNELVKEGGAISALLEMVISRYIIKEIENGITEFRIQRNMFNKNNNALELFDLAANRVMQLVLLSSHGNGLEEDE